MDSNDHLSRVDMTDAQRFQLLVTGVSDYAIYMLDPDGYINSWNTGAQRFKGYEADEIIGKHFSVFYTEEEQAANVPARALRTALAEGKFEAEGWRVRKDGSRFWASVVIDPIRNEAGTLVGFAKVTRDITERKAAQDALRKSEEQFRLLVQGVTDYAIYMLSPDGIITNWNAGAERIKGYSRDDVIGTHFSRFLTAEDRTRGLPAIALATAAKEGQFEREGLRVRKDGSTFWAHVVIDAIRDEQGMLIGFAKITRDITEKKQAAEALEKANAALFQAQKMEAIGQLTGGVAHDFNNLLSVVSSGLDVLSMRLQNPADIKILESMQRAVERGASLTQQLLTFARRQPLTVDNCNLNTLIAGFDAVLRRAVDSSITFEVHMEKGLKTVSIDAARFEAALLNLVVNARDAMPDGGSLSITTGNVRLGEGQIGHLAAGQYVRVLVSDTGSGMPTEVAARAFEPFFTTKEIGKGTGLGLSQVHGFIAQSGGDVVIESEVGKGTTIAIYLPALSETMDDAEAETSAPADAAVDGGSETVLVVDDEPDVRDAAASLFRSIGYEVITASNGRDAVDILQYTRDINVLFSDVIMPNGLNGIELARCTRKLRPDVKVILTSGYPLPALKAEHGNLDDFTFMNKPYRLSDLAKKLRSVR